MSDGLRLPKLQLFLICACRFAEPVSFSIHTPFIYFMIRDFKMTDELHIGYYASLITSAFAMAQFVSGVPWGSLSDRIGRKPVVLMGLASTCVGVLLFGLSKSFTWSLLTKVFSGLFNGNISVLKSMIAELTENHSPEKRTRAFSMLQVTFGLGSIVGAALGGYLSNPAEKYPYLFGHMEFLEEFPYFLPCFVATCLSSFCWIMGFLFMEETLHVKRSKKDLEEEEESLLVNGQREEVVYGSTATTPAVDQYRENDSKHKETIKDILTPQVLPIIGLYAIVAFQMLYFDELFPTWSATPQDAGGLGFQSSEIGTILSFAGSVMLFVQIFVLHRLTAYFGGLVKLFQVSLLSSALVFLAQGTCRLLFPLGRSWVWVALAVCLTIKSLSQTIAITTAVILVNNSVLRADTLGFINGFSQCCNAAMRTLSPAVAGYIWSSFITSIWIPLDIRAYIPWGILGLLGFMTFFAGARLNPLYYDKPHNR